MVGQCFRQIIMLCLLADIKTRLAISGSGEDSVLNALGAAVEERFNRYCNRTFARSATASFLFDAAAMQVSVDRYPVESVTALYTRSDAGASWDTQDTDYEILDGGIISLSVPLGYSGQMARVVYAGGYVLPGGTPTGSQVALPGDIVLAALDQTCLWYEQRHSMRTMQLGGKGQANAATSALQLMPHVTEILDPYRRINA